MKKNPDEVVIKRQKIKKKTNNKSSEDRTDSGKNNSKFNSVKRKLNSVSSEKQVKIISVLLFLFSFLLFIALISYTSQDEALTELSFSEVIHLLGGDAEMAAKADNTQNWLGLLGAVISHTLYNSTLGYSVLVIPFLLFFYAKELFSTHNISSKLIKRTIVYLIFATLFASLFGTLQRFDWFNDLPREFSGATGMFIASVTSGIIGSVGAFLLFMALIIITVILGTDINVDALLEKTKFSIQPIREKVNSFIAETKTKKKNIPEDNIDEDDEDEEYEDEVTETEIPDESQPKIQRIKKSKISHQSESKNENKPTIPTRPKENFNSYDEDANTLRKSFNIKINNMNEDLEVYPPLDDNENNDRNSIVIKPSHTDSENNDTAATPNIKAEKTIIESESKTKDEQEYQIADSYETKIASELINTDTDNKSEQQNDTDDYDHVSSVSDNDNDVLISSDNDESDSEEINSFSDETETSEDIPKINYTPAPPPTVMNPDRKDYSQSRSGVKPLIVTVQDIEPEERVRLERPLSTMIHDEEINYKYPSSDILVVDDSVGEINDEELKMNATILQEKLETFKIFIENLTVTPGPVVTQYEFVPAPGIKISKIESLSDDIAMALKARGIRIIAPVPGKGTVGIEIPNQNPLMVRFSSIVNSKTFNENHFNLPLALGKTINGEVLCTDLAKMPHMLIAGSTGAGKSVGINTIISSLLYKMHPKNLKFVIIDPKKVELQQYSRLENHFLAASPDLKDLIITNPEDAIVILKAACAEMDKRYDILAAVGQRNIFDYNKKVREGKLTDQKNIDHREMPFIVVVIDELADLMLTASKEVEPPIIRLAQLARAVGIHLVVATQRPSVDVITGIIKANFPARNAYLVASKIDSRTILDMGGAEQLLGNGDMLFLPGGQPKPVRVQNAFISTDEVEDICDFIANQKGYSEPYMLPSLVETNYSGGGIAAEDRDQLFEDAARLIVSHQQGSVSLIQRRLKVGYARAGRIIDELEDAGVVGPFDGSKARIVLMESEADLEAIL